ncbi:hypothetical protein [Tenacibaculum finnmarkense]|nr:hypothetical protein [Tenacibaculum finnmarkense]MCG8208142.1 hypothetical protein [Tenacibaculum finnmarkense genomovar finnmarkense]MCG8724148.1 hypothetical protein [Tenacibaculum finnmarkense]MCG8742705.1 hypothetical protein [Tenacibaculum finnmarkense]MCG8765928.1 hypothetical protein [Tenacibaculum finnmarkense]MCG8778801.1 hypothetical protein [Tenacibaculum finnmarkense]
MGIELEGLEMIPFPVRSIGDGIAQSFNSTTGSVNRSVNRTINSAQSFVVENKETILGVASSIQKTGDMATTVSLVSAAAGSMVAGVGAAPGSALAVAGGIVEGIGNVLEIVTNAITENYGDSVSKIAVEVVGEVTGSVIDKVIPGPNPDFSKPVKDLITNTSEALNHLTKNKVKEVVQPVIKKSIDILEE